MYVRILPAEAPPSDAAGREKSGTPSSLPPAAPVYPFKNSLWFSGFPMFPNFQPRPPALDRLPTNLTLSNPCRWHRKSQSTVSDSDRRPLFIGGTWETSARSTPRRVPLVCNRRSVSASGMSLGRRLSPSPSLPCPGCNLRRHSAGVVRRSHSPMLPLLPSSPSQT